MEFTDSIENNLEVIRELLGGVSPGHRNMARRAAVDLENCFTRLQKDNPKNPAVALGAAFAVYTLAQRLVDAGKGGDREQSSMIQLLS